MTKKLSEKLRTAEGYGLHIKSAVQLAKNLEALEEAGVDSDLWYFDETTGRLVSTVPVQTTLNSLYLKDHMRISSAGVGISVTNLDTNDYSFPVAAVLHDHSIPVNRTNAGVTRASADDFGEIIDDGSGGFEPRGGPASSGMVPFVLDTVLQVSISIFEILVIAEETIEPTDTLHYAIYSGTTVNDREVYEQQLTGISVAQGGDFAWEFDGNSNLLAGSTLHVEMLIDKGTTGEGLRPLQVRPSEAQPTEIYAKLAGREYALKVVAYKDEVDAIVSGAEYKGAWDASTNTPDLTGGGVNKGEFYRVQVAGTQDIGSGNTTFDVGDIVIWNSASWDHIPTNAVTIESLEQASLGAYDITVDSNYTGTIETGSSLYPFKTIAQAIANAVDGSSILIKGDHVITQELVLPNNKSLSFYGSDRPSIGYASYDSTNGNVFFGDGLDKSKDWEFHALNIRNAGGYGIRTKNTNKTVVRDCDFRYNGWNGTQLNPMLPSVSTGLLGYDSDAVDLQAFYASDNASDGGALRIEDSTYPDVIGNQAFYNLRGLRMQDCGINGKGFVTRNISSLNIDSGIYLATGVNLGCQNVVVTINYSAFNTNNGILCVGGLNNKFSQNEMNGNWNAGFCAWAAGNTTLRDCGLYDNNRSQFNGIGNTGDAKASIQINDAYNLLGTTISMNPAGRFIIEILDTQVHYTGLGSSTERIGIHLGEELGNLPESSKNLIKIDDVGFLGQDYAIDMSEVDLTNLKVSLGDNSYQNIGISAINEPLEGQYYELPYSNHITDIQLCDISLDVTGNVIFKEGPSGSRLNPYKVNDLQAVAHGTDVRFLLKGTNKIQWEVPLSGISVNGSMVNSVLSLALVQLNDVLTNTTGFTTGNNPVTNFALSGDDLTITLQDGTSYTVDVTTLGVDGNKFVSSGALVGSNLELTMNDSSVITIDVSNMINGSSLPARAEDWYIAYGNNSGDVVIYPSVVTAIKGKQPFYNGDFLEKGEEYIWTHEVGGEYVLGVYTGAEETSDEVDIFLNNKWSTNFKFDTTVKETSVGVDVGSRYASGYTIDNSTLLGLSYDSDNYLRLWDLTSGSRVLIGESNAALVGDDVTIFFGGDNQPNAKFPVMTKRYSEWTIVHDFDSSETSVIDGLEADTVIESNISISPGEKFMANFNFAGRASRFGIGYNAGATGNINAHTSIHSNFAYGTAEQLVKDNADWNWNTSASLYDAAGPRWSRGNGVNLGMISLRYNTDNSLELYSEDVGEVIATKATNLDGSPIRFYFGVNENTTPEYVPSISKQTIGQGSQPVTTFAPDISNQSFDITKSQAFNVPIALDAGSDIVNQYAETDAPSWATLNQATGYFNGTAPSTTGAHVVNCKAANAIGGITNFQVTLNVVEPVYTNTKSLKFQDGVSSYLGGNAALVTALERSANGAGTGDAWTVAFWFKGSTSNTGQTLFYFGGQDVVNTGHIEIKQTNHNGLKRLRLRYGSNGNHLQFTTPSGSIDPTQWQHVIVSYNGGTTGSGSSNMSDYYSRFKIFIDGVLMTTSNTHSNYGWSNSIVGQNFRFGRFASGNYPKDLLLNQLAIWDSDQSSNAAGLYNNGDTQDISLLASGFGLMNVAYLPPDHYYEIESSVSTIQDIEGTAHLVGYNFVSGDLVDDAP